MKKLSFIFYLLLTVVLIGCQQENAIDNEEQSHSSEEPIKNGDVVNLNEETTTISSGNINAEEALTLDSNADIFQYEGVIYKTNIEWVEELSLTKDIQIGEIKAKNNANTDFKDGMSNKLPVGAKIFTTNERGDILIVEYEGEIKKYLAIVEG